MQVIDCRARPDTAEFLASVNTPELLNDMRKMKSPPLSAPLSLEESIRRFESEGVDRIVCMGRDMGSTGGVTVDNSYVAGIASASNGKIIGIAGIDPLKKGAADYTEYCIRTLGLKGISMDPAFMDMYADDRRIYPVYEVCAALGVPVFLTIGPRPFGNGTRMCYCNPLPIDNVAADFPALRLLVSHGGFPWMQEMIAIAFRNDNVWFETSAYWFMPGVMDMVVQAANTVLPDKICFGTAYPFAPMGSTLERFKSFPFHEDVLPRILGLNILDLLGRDKTL